jgi:hypothetical protein
MKTPPGRIPENCAHTYANYITPISYQDLSKKPTFSLLNSGLVVLQPSDEMVQNIRTVLDTDPEVPNFKFPDQDFLSHLFRGKWVPLGYQYNALKTLRSCHKPIWRDEDVKNVHYILDKPWASRIGAGTAPQDEVLHSWWWDAFEELKRSWGEKRGWDVVESTVIGQVKSSPQK